jgi:general secretion pathway protein M
MIADKFIGHLRWDRQTLSALIYAALVVLAGFAVVLSTIQMVERYRSYRETVEMLARFEERRLAGADTEAMPWPPGSPFLDGPSETVASATLMQLVTGAITRVGGSVVSTEVEPQAAQPKDQYLRVIATCDLEQGALQRFLHDIEAGMPFLFVDQLLVQSATTPNDSARLRVRVVISGLWPRTK